MTAMSAAHELARQVRAFQTTAVVVNLALPVMLDPSLPLVDYYARLNRMSRADVLEMPVDLVRADGTRNSRRLGAWLQDAVANQGKGLGLGDDLVAFGMIYATTRGSASATPSSRLWSSSGTCATLARTATGGICETVSHGTRRPGGA